MANYGSATVFLMDAIAAQVQPQAGEAVSDLDPESENMNRCASPSPEPDAIPSCRSKRLSDTQPDEVTSQLQREGSKALITSASENHHMTASIHVDSARSVVAGMVNDRPWSKTVVGALLLSRFGHVTACCLVPFLEVVSLRVMLQKFSSWTVPWYGQARNLLYPCRKRTEGRKTEKPESRIWPEVIPQRDKSNAERRRWLRWNNRKGRNRNWPETTGKDRKVHECNTTAKHRQQGISGGNKEQDSVCVIP
ncbi:hypothetical protein DFH08DRAFT_810470 [Mycena albidolilacea]|uniref:Uncharacterized protein n=1 Tax=Mycena albidolilacea TaxID=1033008 RepID=A0AAD6ZZ82_9AGAR|nr:hypothetical protein DFH08DRAFT_810470 [Mycena albidolilacea]